MAIHCFLKDNEKQFQVPYASAFGLQEEVFFLSSF